MRYLTLLFIAFVLTACHSKPNAKDKWLEDTISALRKQADFKPLPLDEAYDFINKYYLPKLDSTRIGRKIGIYPLTGTDYKARYRAKEKILKGDSILPKVVLAPPKYPQTDNSFKWTAWKLQNCAVVTDSLTPAWSAAIQKLQIKLEATRSPKAQDLLYTKWKTMRQQSRSEFHRRYGRGYMVISYPQYNSLTNKLILEEWVEDSGATCMWQEKTYVFKKTAKGWKEL